MISISAISPLLPAPAGDSSIRYPGLGICRARDSEDEQSESDIVEFFTEFVEPPELPDAVKAEALKGTTCYYGFYFPDTVQHVFDKAHAIERAPDADPWAWKWLRKTKILENAADGLGIEPWTHLAMSTTEGPADVDAGDIVYFAYLTKYKFVSSQCLPVFKIRELMCALGTEGEPRWIPGW